MAGHSGQNFLNLLFGGLDEGINSFNRGQERGQDLALNLHQMRARAASDQQKFDLSETTAERRHQEQLLRIGTLQQNANTNEMKANSTAMLGLLGLNQDDKHFRDNLSFKGQELAFKKDTETAAQGFADTKQAFFERINNRRLTLDTRRFESDKTHDEGMLRVAETNATTAQSRADSYRMLTQSRASGNQADERIALTNLIKHEETSELSSQSITESTYYDLPEEEQLKYKSVLGKDEIIRYRRLKPEAVKNIARFKARLEEIGMGTVDPVTDSIDVGDALNMIDQL